MGDHVVLIFGRFVCRAGRRVRVNFCKDFVIGLIKFSFVFDVLVVATRPHVGLCLPPRALPLIKVRKQREVRVRPRRLPMKNVFRDFGVIIFKVFGKLVLGDGRLLKQALSP